MANETLKVVIPKPRHWKSVPGGHAFIHFIRPTCFWQNHPFTFVESPDGKSILVYCKVKGGITHSLYRYLSNNPGQTASIRVGVEGPYGEPTPARYADTAVFVAGGGIPGIYSKLQIWLVECQRKLKLSSNCIGLSVNTSLWNGSVTSSGIGKYQHRNNCLRYKTRIMLLIYRRR